MAALSPERRLELAEAAADFHARTTSPDALLRRLGERIGRPAARAPALRLRREARSRRRAIFLSPNGIGMGHLTRLLAVARRCSADLEPVFLSMSQAVGVVREWGYVAEYFPYHAHTGETADAWNAALRARLEEAIAFYDARCVVFDGNVPYQGLTACRRAHPDRAFVWIRRGLWRAEAGRAAIERSRHFDLVVEPGELAASLDVGATAGRRDETVQVPPVLLLDAEELLDRDAARAELGLDPGRTAVLVQLGSRNNFDYAAIDQAILDELGGRPDVELVHVDWLIGEAEPELPPRVRRLRTFPVTRYLRAFDLAVSAVGYNSFHELLAFGVPSIFVPNENPIMDAQELRAAWAERHGLALAVGRRDPYRMVRALRSLLDPATRAEISARCAALPRMDGAAQVARHIDQISAAVRALSGSGWPGRTGPLQGCKAVRLRRAAEGDDRDRLPARGQQGVLASAIGVPGQLRSLNRQPLGVGDLVGDEPPLAEWREVVPVRDEHGPAAALGALPLREVQHLVQGVPRQAEDRDDDVPAASCSGRRDRLGRGRLRPRRRGEAAQELPPVLHPAPFSASLSARAQRRARSAASGRVRPVVTTRRSPSANRRQTSKRSPSSCRSAAAGSISTRRTSSGRTASPFGRRASSGGGAAPSVTSGAGRVVGADLEDQAGGEPVRQQPAVGRRHQPALGGCRPPARVQHPAFGPHQPGLGPGGPDVVDREVDRGVAAALRHRRADGAAHAGVEQRRRPAAVGDAPHVVDEALGLALDHHPAGLDLREPERQRLGHRGRRQLAVADAPQELEPRQLAPEPPVDGRGLEGVAPLLWVLASGGEGLDAGLGAAQDQGVDVVGALVGVDRLEVHDVADDVVLVGDAVAAVHVARHPRDVERLAGSCCA